MSTIDISMFDAYKQYKAGTNKVTTWLASRAREMLIFSDLFPNTSERKGKGRLKAIPRIAQAIANIKGQVVPGAITQTLQDVIAARVACNECFQQQGTIDPSMQESNRKHQHFIEILRETLDILKPLSNISGEKKDKGNNDSDKTGLGNLFGNLEIEEPTEWTSSSLPPKPAKAPQIYELENTEEEILYAIFCLLKDMTDLRYYVRQTWADLRNPTNKNDDDFATYSGANFKIPSTIFFCENTYQILKRFFVGTSINSFQQDEAWILEQRFTKNEKALIHFLALFGILAIQCKGNIYGDQLVHGLYIIKKDKIVYTWVVFAFQLFIDTRHVVGKDLPRCFDETQQLRKWISATLEQALIFGQTNTINHAYQLNCHLLQNTMEEMKMLLEEDFMQTLKNRCKYTPSACDGWGSFYLYRNHPMLMGLMAQKFLTRINQFGTALSCEQYTIMTSIHLYNISQQSVKMPKGLEWIDLEKVIEWQDPSWVFVGDRPKLPTECFRHY
ncbi:hypothetical protein N431DRAFT_463284 [Stipitochalara longipes BDJ]|nr:hypothetical protein N431DRAFT_463284 [Stipitochalara longipes BDJ]